ncbi:restriction endonuclease subunit S [Streptomyces sp. NPDC004542]|uniref:restriction endonuclease subunit S n=1 Tax=Streptomyces sp. NPDC004542 TaxID=3154281 RepID=UPI0033A7C785
MTEWLETTLDKLVKLQRGHDLPASQREAGSVPVMGAAGQSGTHDTAIVKAPGVVLGRAGASMGKATYCDVDFWPLNTSLYVTDFLGNEPRFVYYLLSLIDFSGYNSGAAQPMLNRNYIKQIKIFLPRPQEQKAIAEVAGALDEKIAVNERIAAAATSLGEALFRRTAQSGDGSKVLGDLIDLKYGKSLPASRREQGRVPVFGSGGVSGSHNASLVSGPGVIVGRKGTVGAVYWSQRDFFPIDTTFYVSLNSPDFSMEYAYFALRELGLEHMNSDSAVPGLNRANALAQKVKAPSPREVRNFTDRAHRLFQLKHQHEEENISLAALRDTLLPQLMSGKLRVRDAEKIVEDAV